MSITYFNNICWNVRYKRLRLVLSIAASREALHLKLDLYDCKKYSKMGIAPEKEKKILKKNGLTKETKYTML